MSSVPVQSPFIFLVPLTPNGNKLLLHTYNQPVDSYPIKRPENGTERATAWSPAGFDFFSDGHLPVQLA